MCFMPASMADMTSHAVFLAVQPSLLGPGNGAVMAARESPLRWRIWLRSSLHSSCHGR